MSSFFENVRRRQLLLNMYLFLCNLAVALAFLKIWSDETIVPDLNLMLVNKNHLIAFQRGVKNNSNIDISSDIAISN